MLHHSPDDLADFHTARLMNQQHRLRVTVCCQTVFPAVCVAEQAIGPYARASVGYLSEVVGART